MLRKEYLLKDMRAEMQLTEKETKRTYDAMCEVICESLIEDGKVELQDVGKVKIAKRIGRAYIMPNKEKIIVKDSVRLSIKASKEMIFKLNKK